jgi:two-component system cell cycle sensor histidine kinase/response regulator CckA
LSHQHKMEAVGRLAAGNAHDFNNLLFLILGYTEEIMRTSTLAERDVKALTEIKKAGENATNITQQLLKFSRKEAIQKRDLNLNEVIRDTEELFRRMGGVSVKWNFRLEANLGLVRGDVGQLKQVLMNLAANARDAMPDGGRVTIETTTVDVPRANYSGTVRDTFVALTVTDTGIGMSPDTAEHLFEPFFTTKEPGSGTGLGLSIVHTIVTDHGGTIHVDAEPGRGAAFTLYFPRVAEVAAPPPVVEKPAARDGSSAQTILLVDDQKDVRGLLLAYLENSGCKILEAENGEEAIKIARDYPGTIDLLITDVRMPKATGFEVARALSSHRGVTKTIFISGYAQDLVDGRENLPSGARFLPKPFAKRDFLQNVSDLLSQNDTLTMKSGA